ncbi:hypothetical protein SY88_17020 [Clostridiales bacterium PH28_bin88]|nr:hypothetical protein SY88_17020 [Clostridiales bacterium PH28_bin88]
MPTIVISGYYGFNNAGDEAVLYSIVRTLKKQRPGARLVVLSNDPKRTARAYGVESVNRWNPFTVLQALWEADLLISGGGSLLQDATGPRSILYYLGIVWAAKLFGKPVAIYAQGIGPVNGTLGRRLIRRIVNRVDVVSVRDARSRQELMEMEVTRPPVHVTADPVLALDRRELDLEAGRELLLRAGIVPGDDGRMSPVVGVSVREWQGLTGYRAALARACDDLARQGWRVLFVPMQFPADIVASREVARQMQEKSYVLKENCSVSNLMGLIGNLDLVIGMRLHALIMAGVARVPMVGICYDPKVTSFLKQVEQPSAGKVETLTYEEVRDAVQGVLAQGDEVRQQLAERVAEMREEARESARLALGLLK